MVASLNTFHNVTVFFLNEAHLVTDANIACNCKYAILARYNSKNLEFYFFVTSHLPVLRKPLRQSYLNHIVEVLIYPSAQFPSFFRLFFSSDRLVVCLGFYFPKFHLLVCSFLEWTKMGIRIQHRGASQLICPVCHRRLRFPIGIFQ